MATQEGDARQLPDTAREELARLDRRLRSLSVSAWRSRRQVVDDLLGQLAALTAEVEGHDVPSVPDLPDYAVADAIAVLGGDVLAAVPGESITERLLHEVRLALAATR